MTIQTAAPTADAVRAALQEALRPESVTWDPAILQAYSRDYGPVDEPHTPLAVVFAGSAADVQATLRLANTLGFSVVARGAGTGVSGGAHATENTVVLSLERMNRILELRPEDEVAVVEPGVVNGDLNAAAAGHGLMYAPDPASFRQATIGGNIATNAGGLRCAKYGVTRDSVLGLDVVLADGTLIHVGRNTFKGVAGYDLTSLFVGSEGTLGIVVAATVRLRYLSVVQKSVAALFPDTALAAAGVLAIARARVQPAILELLDAGTLEVIDQAHGTNLAARGGTLLLVRTDGHGAAIEEALIREALGALGAEISAPGDPVADQLVELRRSSRGDGQDDEFRVGEDVAVPRSRLVGYITELGAIAARHDVKVRVVAHAGDGNLHPTFWVDPAEGPSGIGRLQVALDESVRAALDMGGTITGEHGVGQFKRRWLGWEQQAEVLELQRRLKDVFDPRGILNPGKAIQ
ncbi:FAD-binding oxidoreductase [Arthrobacter mobilis]|uniref:FAD-binding protein n=1 Tax=Arthrobacter mobilis TaxID=2724944 RepID=A0A7X6HCB4_9MICC|nr:FAD-linked oxidase C-terminal domain-containing protein [Arthrobacter mobilis]NKX54361.1 FAD-binding protein [Arthrobacter mobilis]